MTSTVFVNDFHCSFLWIRALEMITSRVTSVQAEAFGVELVSLFGAYRSPWRA